MTTRKPEKDQVSGLSNSTPLQEAIDKASYTRKTSGHGESDPCITFTWGTTHDVNLVMGAAQKYADLPEKIEGMKEDKNYSVTFKGEYNYAYNQALDDILNLLKEEG